MGGGVSGSKRVPHPAPPSHDPAFQAVKDLVVARTGHHYYTDKDSQFWERLAPRMQALGIKRPAEYLERLEDPSLGAKEWRALESAVTINETFFFRFAEQFDVLRRVLLPELLRHAAQERRLRIWSVGCSNGAEPYSIAILLHDLLGEQLPDWRITITGTDIDADALENARAALYTPWALRTLAEPERLRLFDRQGERYRLKPRYRGMVRFEHHNMMSLFEPASALQFTDFDLILCRNVLIYFRHDVATGMVGALAQRLLPHGTLFVGHAEPSPEFAAVAVPVEIAGLLAYRPLGTEPPPAAAPTLPPLPTPPLPARSRTAPPPPRRRPARAATRSRPVEPLPAARAPGDGARDALRTALAAGDAETALQLAAQESSDTPRDPVPHYLAALGALALGDDARAEEGFRKALFLDNSFAMAHYLLGRHLMAQNRTTDGRRALTNALRAVTGLEPDAPLAEGDGMTAGALAAAVRSTLG